MKKNNKKAKSPTFVPLIRFSRRHMLIVALIMAVVGVVALVSSFAANPPIGSPDAEGAFYAECVFSHRSSDDAIVFPNAPGAAHSHDFLGNTSTDAFSTNNSLRAGSTNCHRSGDKSAYWIPTLYVNEQAITPAKTAFYYRTGYRKAENVKAFPADLRVIAGDSKGLSPAERNGQGIYMWGCAGVPADPGSATVMPTCAAGDVLTLLINFPDCWDGFSEDSSNHKVHMEYSATRSGGGLERFCPSTHPVLVPQLSLSTSYPTTGGPTARLSSGGIQTAHADFMNGWDQAKMDQLMHNCINIDIYCGGQDSAAHQKGIDRLKAEAAAAAAAKAAQTSVTSKTPKSTASSSGTSSSSSGASSASRQQGEATLPIGGNPGSPYAAPAGYPVAITVIDSSGKIVAGAKVTIDKQTVSTDTSGVANFTGIAAGKHDIRVKSNKGSIRSTIDITDEASPNNVQKLTVKLHKNSLAANKSTLLIGVGVLLIALGAATYRKGLWLKHGKTI
jgi:hypothetical protein